MTTTALLMVLAGIQTGPDRIDLDPSSLTLDTGERATVAATVRDETGAVLEDASVLWIAMTPEVAQVDQTGVVTAVSPGEARIAARSGNVMSFASVVVRALPVAALEASLPTAAIVSGTSAPVRVVAMGQDGEAVPGPSLSFSSSDEEVAGVDGSGRVYGRRAGQAVVTVSSGGVSASVDVEVSEGDPGSVEITPSEVRARTGDVIRFEARGATMLYPEWSVSGAGAQIEAEGTEGVFVAERPGTYRVTAIYGEGRAAVASAEITTRIEEAELVRVGRGAAADHHSGDTWVFEGVNGRDYAYVGTYMYDWMKAWDVATWSTPSTTGPATFTSSTSRTRPTLKSDAGACPSPTTSRCTTSSSRTATPISHTGTMARSCSMSVPGRMAALPPNPRSSRATAIRSATRTPPGAPGCYLFVGDEIFPDIWDADTPIEARGYIHVLDMEDPENPVEVARYEVPEAGAHNIWVEGDLLYVGYYQAGLRVVDISGELRGDLYRQGREIAVLKTIDSESTVPNWGMTWGAQIHKGHIFTSDLNSGLWVVKLVEGQRIIS